MRVKVPFVGGSSRTRSRNADDQKTLNCYLEMDNSSPRAPIALYGTPGTVLRFTLPTGPSRAAIAERGYSWRVAGNTVYRVDTAFNVTTLGTIGTSSGAVSMASNGSQIIIVDGVAGWLINTTLSTLTQITDEDFPNGVKRATFQDGYFAVTGLANSQAFYINNTAYVGASWDALDFASAEGSPDLTLGIISDHLELWLFGANSAEVWNNTGQTDFPFARSASAFIEHGCIAAGTIAKADNTVFWLGGDDKGAGIVWRAMGYTPARISDHALEFAIGGYETIDDAFAFTYQQEGHIFYVLTFPSAGATWVYDAATQVWHERAWRNPDTGEMTRWRPNCMDYFNGEHLVGDFEDGRVYALDLDHNYDDGDPIIRLRRAATNNANGLRMFFSSLEIDMEVGVGLATGQGSDPKMMLRYSDDGGHTWSNQKTATIGKVGQYGARCKFNRLGAGRNRVWEISMSDPVKFAVFGAFAEGEPGVN